jgi:hypothetical protein
MPRRSNRYTSSFSHTPSCGVPSGFASYRYMPRIHAYEPEPPSNGSSPISLLPDELWLEILRHMDWQDLLPLRRVDRRLSELVLSPGLHRSLTLTTLPPMPLPDLMTRYLLAPVKHLHLHLLPYPSTSSRRPSETISALLDLISPDQLLSLSLPFSAPYLSSNDLGRVLSRIGGRLEKLDLKGSGIAGKSYLEWIDSVGNQGAGLKELDLGFTNITELPTLPAPPNSQAINPAIARPFTPPPEEPDLITPSLPFHNLTHLSLASCTSLSPSTIYTFLSHIPPTLASLDISRLEQTSFQALYNLRVTYMNTLGELVPTALKEIKVIGIDHLTRLDIRRLKHHWESQRRDCSCFQSSSESMGMGLGVDIPLPKARVWGEPRTPEMPPWTPPSSAPSSAGSPASWSRGGSGVESTINTSSSRLQTATRSISPDFELRTPKSPLRQGVNLDYPPPTGEKCHPFLDFPSTSNKDQQLIRDVSPEAKGGEEEIYERVNIHIIHSAILESEDEAGYRQFIGEVAGGTVGLGFGRV